MLEKWPDTDAIFCSGDVLAIGAICEARRRGLNIPKDIAICGFGDIEFGNKFGIGLTTVKVRGEEIGEQAANLIVQRSKNITLKKKTINVGFDIVKRETA
jgi:LacI family gluconate utilization system Gnt-I transcriptional repressor